MAGLFLLFFAVPRHYAFAVLTSVLLHELGHLAAASLLGGSARAVRLMPTGVSISLSPAPSYWHEIIIASAGPLMNLLYLTALPFLPITLQDSVRATTLTLMTLNLLPIKTMDGGRILHAILSLFFGENTAEKAIDITTALALSALWILSLYIFFYSGVNFMLLLFCAYLFSYLVLKKL